MAISVIADEPCTRTALTFNPKVARSRHARPTTTPTSANDVAPATVLDSHPYFDTLYIAMPPAPTIQQSNAGRPRDPRLDGAILDATIELIEEQGFRELTMVAVAERAGTTTAAIYRRWPSKADLVVRAVFRTEGPDVIADTGDLEEDLRTMIRATLEKFGRPIGRAALAGLLSEPLGGAERLAQLHTVWGLMGERLARAADAGEIRPDVDTESLISVTAGAGMLVAILHGDRAVDEVRIDSIVSLVMDGVRPSSGNGARRPRGAGR